MDRSSDHSGHDSLNAMRAYLYGLENVEMLNPDDIEVLRLRRVVRQKVDRLEREAEESDRLKGELHDEEDGL